MTKKSVPQEHQLYQTYDLAEDADRSKSHYEQDPQFYYYQTGGEWNVYSSLVWPREDSTGTEAQEAKLDLLAEAMQLKPGMHILDVGCGWGGPLTYFCKKYGVTGEGITVSPKQRDAAQARAAKYGVDARFHLTHWEHFRPERTFDAVYSDEVIVHFGDLGGFFARAWEWLRMNGRFVNKELHYSHHRHSIFGRTGEHVHAIFGFSGHYRLLADELQLLNDNGFELIKVHHIAMADYRRTMDFWLNNLFVHQQELKKIAGEEFYDNFRKYLKIMRRVFATNAMILDVVVSEKIDPNEHA